jgi:hypothetical protein
MIAVAAASSAAHHTEVNHEVNVRAEPEERAGF